MIASHAALMIGLVFMGVILLSMFLFNTPGFEKCLRFLSSPVGTAFVRPPSAELAAARKDCHQVLRASTAR